MLVKCKCHIDNKVDRDTAFKIKVNGLNEYYCSEQDYLIIKEAKESRKILLDKINDVFGYSVTNTILYKEIKELLISNSYTKLNSYINDNFQMLQKYMSKPFNNEYGKIKYFTTIIRNNIRDYIMSKPETARQSDAEIIGVRYTPKNRKKNMNQYLDELE